MTPGAVGFQCPECVAQGKRETRQGELPYGGRPSRDPKRTTIALIGMNVAVWAFVLLTGGSFGRVFNLLAITPMGYCGPTPDNQILLVNQAQCASTGLPWVDGVSSGAWWQLITNAFTHADALHIAFNMFALWILAPQLERLLGRTRFLALYLVSALAASAFIMLFSQPYVSTLGASGAVFGMLGAFLLVARKHGGDVRQILILLGINVVITVVGSSYISWQGHFGGLIGGLAVTAALIHLPKQYRKRWQWPLVALVGVASLVAAVAKALQLA